jgi:ribosomal protein L20A (L18A)
MGEETTMRNGGYSEQNQKAAKEAERQTERQAVEHLKQLFGRHP